MEEAERTRLLRRPAKERPRRNKDGQLPRLLHSEPVRERVQGSAHADRRMVTAQLDREEEACTYSAESAREHSPAAQCERAAVAAQQQAQPVATVKKEEEQQQQAERSRQEASSSFPVALPSPSAPQLFSSTAAQLSPRSALQHYPIARPSSAATSGSGDASGQVSRIGAGSSSTPTQQQVAAPPDAKVKKEEAVEWSSNPIAQP